MSDNAAGVHPKVLEKIAMVNVGHEVAYGYDQYTQKATDLFKQHFGSEIEVLLTLTGTGSNVIALQSMLQSYHAVICGRNAHLYADECGAPEKFIGAKLIPIETYLGKLTIEGIKAALQDMHLVHRVQPKVVSITQATEWGTLYTIDEIKTIADFCRKYQLYLHMDGARLANAASALNVTFKQITTDLKVDVISFGGTKNGLLGAEAVIIVNPQLAKHSPFIRKQAMQLSSKMRFIAAQFLALFEDELWLQNANHANQMAKLLYEKIKYNTSII